MNDRSPSNADHADNAPSLDPPIACDLTAIPDRERAAHMQRAEHIYRAAIVRREQPNGWDFSFDAAMLAEICRFIDYERRCCPFFTFALEIPLQSAPVWLRITGIPPVKAFLAAELASHDRPDWASQKA